MYDNKAQAATMLNNWAPPYQGGARKDNQASA
ncbi:Uncharacterised protein [Yersinia intermedia]|uniref:Uncharacterized protein n=1 Tax=Yersinia intermedia TaxID=631 RepID=A0A0H5LQ03_YERIN|nr:Uncharacterised protein [Yersinia intermedia]